MSWIATSTVTMRAVEPFCTRRKNAYVRSSSAWIGRSPSSDYCRRRSPQLDAVSLRRSLSARSTITITICWAGLGECLIGSLSDGHCNRDGGFRDFLRVVPLLQDGRIVESSYHA